MFSGLGLKSLDSVHKKVLSNFGINVKGISVVKKRELLFWENTTKENELV